MKNLQILTILSTLFIFPVIAIAQKPKNIVFSIDITDEILNDVRNAKDPSNITFKTAIETFQYNDGEDYPIKFKNKHLEIIISPKTNQPNYFKIFIDRYISSFPVYLVEPGDSIYFSIKGKYDYSLKSNNKALELQQELTRIQTQYSKPTSPLSIQKKIVAQAIDEVAERFKSYVDKDILELVKINAYYEFIDLAVTFRSSSRTNTLLKDTTVTRYESDIKSEYFNNKIIKTEFLIRNSSSYGKYLLNLNRSYNRILIYEEKGATRTEAESRKREYKLTFEALSNNYKEVLKDQLMYLFFLRHMRFSTTSLDDLKATINVTTDSLYKHLLEQLLQQKSPGIPAFPFNLISDNGKYYSLESFKGKVVVAEFYFNGCTPCAYLHKILEPLKERYKQGNNVAFINIAVDATEKLWRDGVKKGIYTSPNDINLYIGTEAFTHPLFLYYKYTGCPQLLLIDKNGKLISSTPVRPTDEKSLMEFDELLSPYINSKP